MSKNASIEEEIHKSNILLASVESKLDTIILILRKINLNKIKEGRKNGV